MRHLIKSNPALATGILLPLLLVVLFSLAAVVPRLLVSKPQYDLLFSMKSYSLQGEYEYKFQVVDEKLKLQARKMPAIKGSGGYDYRLYWYEASTGKVHEISLATSKAIGGSWTNIPLASVQDWKINPSLTAQDGYELHNDYKRTSDLGLIFFSGSQRSAIHISRNGRIVSIYPPKYDRVVNTPEFIGWIEHKGNPA